MQENENKVGKRSVIKRGLGYLIAGTILLGTVDYFNLPSRAIGVYRSAKSSVSDAFTKDHQENYEGLVKHVDKELADMPIGMQKRFVSRYASNDSIASYKTIVQSASESGIDSLMVYISDREIPEEQRLSHSKMLFDRLGKDERWQFTKYATKDMASKIFDASKK